MDLLDHKQRRLRRMIEDLEAEHRDMRQRPRHLGTHAADADRQLRRKMRDLQAHIDTLRKDTAH